MPVLYVHYLFCSPTTFLGSFIEFLPILTLLSNGHTPFTLPYHVIVPSLPGYAFSSGAPLDKDFRLEDIARILNRLVVGLGFEQGYVVQGGDIGSKIARVMAAEHASCKGE
jgi:microsomal epoxide hydrolase